MVGIPSRHKSLVLLLGVVMLQVLLLAVQIKRDAQGRLIRVWTVGAVSPFERVGASGRRWTYKAMLAELPDHPGSSPLLSAPLSVVPGSPQSWHASQFPDAQESGEEEEQQDHRDAARSQGDCRRPGD